MDLTQLVAVVNSSFEFRSTVSAIVLGAYGFSTGRMWPEHRRMPDRTVLWLWLGLIPCLVALWLVGQGYQELGLSISRNALLTYATQWPVKLNWIDLWIMLSAFYLLGYVGLSPRSKQLRSDAA
jgi:hypothetical protein